MAFVRAEADRAQATWRLQTLQDKPGQAPSARSFTAWGKPRPRHRHRHRSGKGASKERPCPKGTAGLSGSPGAAAPGAGCDSSGSVCELAQAGCRKTTKQQLKCQEQIYFHHLTDRGSPKQQPSRGTQAGTQTRESSARARESPNPPFVIRGFVLL